MTVSPIQFQSAGPSAPFDPDLGNATHISELRSSLLRYCRQLTSTDADAEDLVQEVLLKALPVVAGTYTHPNEKAYLLRTVRHAWIDAYRKRHRTRMLVELNDEHLAATTDVLHQLEVSEALALMVNLLTPRERTVLLLSDVFGYAARETAQLLQSTEGAVKAGLRRARKKLKMNREAATNGGLGTVSLNEDQHRIVQAYLAAFNHADVALIIQLARADVLDPVYALAQVVIRAHHDVHEINFCASPESMAMCLAA